MWRDIAIMNKENILHALDYFEDALAELRKAVSSEDERAIEVLLQQSRDTRRAI
jgi:prephenate dehydrogenase